jgi:glycogen operon protein
VTDPLIETGSFHPLGATWDGRGVNFALFSEHATGVDLCLFDEAGVETRIHVRSRSVHVWHVYVSGLNPGQRYGWRVHGPYAPREGHRFNANKLLVDPYARALDGAVDLRGPIYGHRRDRDRDDPAMDPVDDAAGVPKGVVVGGSFDWSGDVAPGVPWHQAVVYELHVKGFTMRHPDVPEHHRGTFLGLASDAVIAHLRSLHVTTVDLMPIQEHADEPALAARGLTNYWGYSTLAYFAPDRRFATRGGDPALELKQAIRRLHAAGIEVLLDVVYNHTCEGDELGPTLGLRGIDNAVYYKLDPRDPSRYLDYTGCGNTLDATHPQVIKLITDSLRYWVTEFHVDGFRFDLAAALGRGQAGGLDRLGAFFAVVHQDPVLSRIKLVAEPWDLGHDGYQVGNFPILWSEWNGRFRDTVRSFWRGERDALGDLGRRLTGSSDLFADDGRHPHASINFVTAHDGFTLRDLVSYRRRHNEANREGNDDGWDASGSQNCGVEGETEDRAIIERRRRIARSVLATLFVSQGVPMISMADELWRTQGGNNNPYCQDSELTWVDWRLDEGSREMLRFARALTELRTRHAVLRRAEFLRGERVGRSDGKDITWLRPDGEEMKASDWSSPAGPALAFLLDGDAFDGMPGSSPERRCSVLVAMNGGGQPVRFFIPRAPAGEPWRIELDTEFPGGDRPAGEAILRPGASFLLGGGGLVVLTRATR